MANNILVGGIRNALQRGQDINKIKQSFINAGYPGQEIEQAFQIANSKPIEGVDSGLDKKPEINQNNSSGYKKLGKVVEVKKKSKWFWIIGISIGVLVLVIALVLGLFWDKLF